jgi:Pyridine nucleotide-disulphide oxidoreductase
MMTRDRNNTSNHPMMKMALRSLLLVLVVVSLLLALVSEAAFVPDGGNRPAWSRRTTTTTTSSTSTILYVQDREKILREEIEQRNNMIQNEKKYAVADGELLDQQRFAGSLDSSEGILATVATSSPTVTSVLAAKEERDKHDDDTTTTETDNVAAATASTSTATLERPAVVAAVTTTEAATTSSSSSTSTSSPSDVPVEKTKTGLAARMERLTKPRAYPLFLAEKAAEIVEAAIHDMSTMLQGDVKTTSLDDSSGSGSSSSNKNNKERIVILGTGWGAASFLKTVDTDLYTVTVISPRNYFVFTPMLAGASVGTVEYRSITEPIREICPGAEYLEATASDIDPVNRLVTCQSVVCDGNSCQVEDFQVSYDKVIVTVGAQTNTFGIPGVREYCCFLKQVEDARRIRTAIVNCFERANLPHLSEQERVDNLTFCVSKCPAL